MTHIDAHAALTLHQHRSAELHAEADRARLARAVSPTRPRWWSRGGRHAGTRAPAAS